MTSARDYARRERLGALGLLALGGALALGTAACPSPKMPSGPPPEYEQPPPPSWLDAGGDRAEDLPHRDDGPPSAPAEGAPGLEGDAAAPPSS